MDTTLFAVGGIVISGGETGQMERHIRRMAVRIETIRRQHDATRCTAQVRFSDLNMSEWVGIVGGWAYRVCGN